MRLPAAARCGSASIPVTRQPASPRCRLSSASAAPTSSKPPPAARPQPGQDDRVAAVRIRLQGIAPGHTHRIHDPGSGAQSARFEYNHRPPPRAMTWTWSGGKPRTTLRARLHARHQEHAAAPTPRGLEPRGIPEEVTGIRKRRAEGQVGLQPVHHAHAAVHAQEQRARVLERPLVGHDVVAGRRAAVSASITVSAERVRANVVMPSAATGRKATIVASATPTPSPGARRHTAIASADRAEREDERASRQDRHVALQRHLHGRAAARR